VRKALSAKKSEAEDKRVRAQLKAEARAAKKKG
jgi:hypothetical protein